MQISKIDNNTSFGAQIVRSKLMNKAIEQALHAPRYEKTTFFNALNEIHNDLTLKSVEIQKGMDSPMFEPKHIVSMTHYRNNYVETFSSIINDKANEGIEAMNSILKFVKNRYRNLWGKIVTTNRECTDEDINNKINELLNSNASRYREV